MIEIDKFILKKTHVGTPVWASLLVIAIAAYYIWAAGSEHYGSSAEKALVIILASILLVLLIKLLYQIALLKIEFKKIYYSHLIPIKWKELDLGNIKSARYHRISRFGFSESGILEIEADSINRFNKVDIPLWFSSWGPNEGSRTADYINDLVTDYWKKRSKDHSTPSETPQPASSERS